MNATREKDLNAWTPAMRRGEEAPVAQRLAFADGCAHRDAQVIAFLNSICDLSTEHATRATLVLVVQKLVRGEHVK